MTTPTWWPLCTRCTRFASRTCCSGRTDWTGQTTQTTTGSSSASWTDWTGGTRWSRGTRDHCEVWNMSKYVLNTLRPRQNGRHFPDDIFKWIFLNENVWISISISLKFVPRGPINNISTLVRVMAWRRPGDKPLSEPMMVRLPTHICVTRPQWVKVWIKDVLCMRPANERQR